MNTANLQLFISVLLGFRVILANRKPNKPGTAKQRNVV